MAHSSHGFVISDMHLAGVIAIIACGTFGADLNTVPSPHNMLITSSVFGSIVNKAIVPSITAKYSVNSGWKWFPLVFPALKYNKLNSLIGSAGIQV